MPKYTVAALQIGTSPEGTAATIEKILSYEEEIIAKGVKLVVVPEATVGGYPKGSTFGAYIGYRTQSGREEYLKYHSQAISIPDGPECDALAKFSARTGAMLVVGTIERDGGTLYCTLAYFDPALGFVCKHRKTMPTASERLVWGQGDGSGLVVAQHAELGPVGGAICWENYMPLLRASFYAKGVKVYVAPTVDERDVWQALMRTIAVEGRCFVVSAVQFLPPIPNMPEWEEGRNAINGGSVIVGPLGEVIAGPFTGQEGLLTAEIEMDKIVEAQFDLDLNGHYSRKDIFTLTVDETPREGVAFERS